MDFKGRRPLIIAFLAEFCAAGVTIAAVQGYFALVGTDMPLALKLVIAGMVAGGVAYILRATLPWCVFLALLPSLFVGAMILQLPLWVPLVILALLVLIMRNSLGERVPLYLSNQKTLDLICSLIPNDRPVSIIDLGCGFGAMPRALARYNTHPDSRFHGVENAPLPFLMAKPLAWRASDTRISIKWQSLWSVDLGAYDLVYAFLSPQPMPQLYKKAKTEMRSGTRFVSNSFTVPDHPPTKTIPVRSGRATELLIWTMSD
ncbi:MAG: class I SAM-dependent methyltransferase [Alphaproteobacteria bacterium]|nr:class I SAM-dependent methyltransferase [Alphaproteobacteria bacterium]